MFFSFIFSNFEALWFRYKTVFHLEKGSSTIFSQLASHEKNLCWATHNFVQRRFFHVWTGLFCCWDNKIMGYWLIFFWLSLCHLKLFAVPRDRVAKIDCCCSSLNFTKMPSRYFFLLKTLLETDLNIYELLANCFRTNSLILLVFLSDYFMFGFIFRRCVLLKYILCFSVWFLFHCKCHLLLNTLNFSSSPWPV